MDPDLEVEALVLDVTEEEARTLLLSIDPLAALADTQAQLRDRLQELAPPVPEDLRLAWEAIARDALEAPPADRRPQPRLEAQFAVLVTCRDEAEQVELLRRFHATRINNPGGSVQTILKALKKHSMFVADSIDWAVSVAPDPRIQVMNEELRKIKGPDFKVVTPPAGYKPPE
jgi:hypothetical protein